MSNTHWNHRCTLIDFGTVCSRMWPVEVYRIVVRHNRRYIDRSIQQVNRCRCHHCDMDSRDIRWFRSRNAVHRSRAHICMYNLQSSQCTLSYFHSLPPNIRQCLMNSRRPRNQLDMCKHILPMDSYRFHHFDNPLNRVRHIRHKSLEIQNLANEMRAITTHRLETQDASFFWLRWIQSEMRSWPYIIQINFRMRKIRQQ